MTRNVQHTYLDYINNNICVKLSVKIRKASGYAAHNTNLVSRFEVLVLYIVKSGDAVPQMLSVNFTTVNIYI